MTVINNTDEVHEETKVEENPTKNEEDADYEAVQDAYRIFSEQRALGDLTLPRPKMEATEEQADITMDVNHLLVVIAFVAKNIASDTEENLFPFDRLWL